MEKNIAQEEAINTIYGQLMLVSCPGSGKTTTMLRRIDHMINSGIDPKSILMVTFSEAAAREMKSRFVIQYGDAPVSFYTIHALCVRIIHAGGIHDLHIMDASEADSALRYASHSIKHYFEDFKDIRNDIGVYKNTGKCVKRSEQSINDSEFQDFIRAYERHKTENKAIDFDDLLIYGKRILTDNPRVLADFRQRFQFIICDEYQDTNPIQKDILYLLCGENGNFCIVGDDDQSIYGFRGAVPALMLAFDKDFPNAKIIHMDTNYRSVPGIIESACLLIRFNEHRFKKNINANRKAGDTEAVFYDVAKDRAAEIDQLVDHIHRYAKKDGYASCAVLSRTNVQLEQVSEYFVEHNIPFTSKDVVRDIYEHWSFTDICAYLKLADGHGNISDFMRIINRPKRYLQPARFQNLPYDQSRILCAAQGLKPYVFDNLLEYFHQVKHLSTLPFAQRVSYILNEIGYGRFLEDYAMQAGTADVSLDAKCNTFIRDSAKFSNLREWINYAKNHVRKFHDNISKHSQDGVILATMHRSKGLEWNHVFLIDCCEQITPYERNDSDCDIEEERRLFYVACTRARETLHVMRYTTKINRKGNESSVSPSRFIREMQSAKQKIVTESGRHEMRNNNVANALSGFEGLDLSLLKRGDYVHHVLYGNGTVINNIGSILSVRFRVGVKMFPYK